MKRLLIGMAAAGLLLTSCGTEEVKKEIDPANVAVAKIEIEGMMCADGCGGKIKKELNELDCVASTTIEFNAENPVDVAVVEFDKESCGEQAFIDQISAIGDGKYAVKNVTIE